MDIEKTKEEIKKATEAAAQGWSPFGPKFTFKTFFEPKFELVSTIFIMI